MIRFMPTVCCNNLVLLTSRMLSILLPLLTFLILLECCSCLALPLISTDPAVSLPDRAGSAELLNSSLEKYQEFTICLRLKTYQFSTYPDKESYQYIVSIKNSGNFMLGSYTAVPCEQVYSGCTGTYQSKIPAWSHGAVFGSLRESDSLLDHFSPWLPQAQWSTRGQRFAYNGWTCTERIDFGWDQRLS